ncbi:DUF2249 domain-containing protein [Pseudopedobacter sp.]|uniref:DUF2249 domain-containing protein n=1 Tax=Pseudopedobacter sp. TaxID=1936787 RepID=UPI00333F6734
MEINQHTKISQLIKANELCIDAIASIAKPLQKLKIPLLRRFLAPRVTIKEASKIAGCSVQQFKQVLIPLGFVWQDEHEGKEEKENILEKRPDWLLNSKILEALDVRPILLENKDPLKEILLAYKKLPQKEVLLIVNSFIPLPLIKRLEEMGALSFTEEISSVEFYTYFYKIESKVKEDKIISNIFFLNNQQFEEKLTILNSKKIIELDVSELAMPEPMERLLAAATNLGHAEIIYAKHRKVPLHLLEELEDYPLSVFLTEFSENDVRILIYIE